MLALAVFGVGRSDRIIELDLRTRPRSRGDRLRGAGDPVRRHRRRHHRRPAHSPRGTRPWSSCPSCCWSPWARRRSSIRRRGSSCVALAVAAGLVSSAQNVTTQRTQANAVAAAINAQAQPGDVIAFCPDQLGPAVYRQLEDPSQYHMITFPRRTGPQIVDWVDCADTVRGGRPHGVRRRRLPGGRADPSHLARLVPDVPDLRDQVRDDRIGPPGRGHQERRRRATSSPATRPSTTSR